MTSPFRNATIIITSLSLSLYLYIYIFHNLSDITSEGRMAWHSMCPSPYYIRTGSVASFKVPLEGGVASHVTDDLMMGGFVNWDGLLFWGSGSVGLLDVFILPHLGLIKVFEHFWIICAVYSSKGGRAVLVSWSTRQS